MAFQSDAFQTDAFQSTASSRLAGIPFEILATVLKSANIPLEFLPIVNVVNAHVIISPKDKNVSISPEDKNVGILNQLKSILVS
jgi:hypothetical protein